MTSTDGLVCSGLRELRGNSTSAGVAVATFHFSYSYMDTEIFQRTLPGQVGATWTSGQSPQWYLPGSEWTSWGTLSTVVPFANCERREVAPLLSLSGGSFEAPYEGSVTWSSLATGRELSMEENLQEALKGNSQSLW